MKKVIDITLDKDLATALVITLREAMNSFEQEFWTSKEEYIELSNLCDAIEKQILSTK